MRKDLEALIAKYKNDIEKLNSNRAFDKVEALKLQAIGVLRETITDLELILNKKGR